MGGSEGRGVNGTCFSKEKKIWSVVERKSLFPFSGSSSYLVVLEAERRRGIPARVVDHEPSSGTLARRERVEEGAADDCVE